jgi:hypothetical protein
MLLHVCGFALANKGHDTRGVEARVEAARQLPLIDVDRDAGAFANRADMNILAIDQVTWCGLSERRRVRAAIVHDSADRARREVAKSG